MTMSVSVPSFSITGDKKISGADLAYFENRLRNRLYDIVMEEFEKAKKENSLTQAALARRLGKRPEQINRWFSTPGNWTIETISNLLIGINGSELTLGIQNIAHHSGMTIEGTTVTFGHAHSVVSVGAPSTNTSQITATPYAQQFSYVTTSK